MGTDNDVFFQIESFLRRAGHPTRKIGSPMGFPILYMGLKRKRHITPINFTFDNAVFSKKYAEAKEEKKESE